MQFDYAVLAIVMILTTFMVIILIKLIYKHNPHYSEHYGEKLFFFTVQRDIKEEYGDLI